MNGNNSLKYTGEAYAGVRRHLEPLLEALGSETAFKIYVLIGGLAVLCLSVAVAFRMMRELRAVEKDAFALRFPGRRPTSASGIEARQKRVESFQAAKWRRLFRHFAGLLVFGFVIPSFCLYFGAAWYSWFDPHVPAFVAGGSGEKLANPDRWLLLAFVFDQFTHGAFMDVAEVFALDFGGIRNNPSNLPFSGAVLLYRSFIGSFAVVAFFFIRRSIAILRALRDERISAPVHA